MDLIKNSRIITAENIDSDNTILLENSTSDATRSGVIFKVNKDIIASQEYVSSFTSEMVRTYKAQGISSLEIPTGITYKGKEVSISDVSDFSQIVFTSDITVGEITYKAPSMFRRIQTSTDSNVGKISVDFQYIGATPHSADDIVEGSINKFITDEYLQKINNSLSKSIEVVTETTSGFMYHDYLIGTIDDGYGGSLSPTESSIIIEFSNLPSSNKFRVEGEIVLDLYQGLYEFHRETMRSVIYHFNGYWNGYSWTNIAYGCTSVLHTMRAAHTQSYVPALILDGVFMNGVCVIPRLIISSSIIDESTKPKVYWLSSDEVSGHVIEDMFIAEEQVQVTGITNSSYTNANGIYKVKSGSGDDRIYQHTTNPYFIWKSTTYDYNMNLSGFPIENVNGSYSFNPGRIWINDNYPKYTIKKYNGKFRVYDGSTIIYSTHTDDGNPYGTIGGDTGSWVWCTGDSLSYINGALAVATDKVRSGWWVLTDVNAPTSSNMVPGMSTVIEGLPNPYTDSGSTTWQNNPGQGWNVTNLSVTKIVIALTTANVAHRDDFSPEGDPSYGQLTFEALFPFWNAVGINKTTNVELPIDNVGTTNLGWTISSIEETSPYLVVDLANNVNSYIVLLGGGNNSDVIFNYSAINGVPGTNSQVVFFNRNTSGNVKLISSVDASQTSNIPPGNILYTSIYTDGYGTHTLLNKSIDDIVPIEKVKENNELRFSHIFACTDSASGYQLALSYAQENGIPGECVSVQHPDTTWGVYQIQNNKTLELVSWYHTSFNFTSEDLDENGNLSVAIGSFPIAVKGGGEVIPVCPSEENTENNIYRLNLNGLIVPGISYKIVTVKE